MRPDVSYREDGRSARSSCLSRTDCPYPVGSLKLLEWQAGWLSCDVAIREEDDEDSDDFDQARHDLKGFEEAIGRRYRHARSLGPALEEIEEIHGSAHGWREASEVVETMIDSGLLDRLEDDMGRCQPVEGLLRRHGGEGLHGHAWLEFENGMVMDVTRWRIDGRAPAVVVDSIACYDLGGMATRPMPEIHGIPPHKLADALQVMPSILRSLLDDVDAPRSIPALAARSLAHLGESAEALYAWLDAQGLSNIVPACNRAYVRNLVEWRDSPLVETHPRFG